MRKCWLASFVWLCSYACTGPSYYVVRSTFTPETANAPEPAITSAKPGPLALGTVALTAEDPAPTCTPQSAREKLNPSQLNELERALVAEGFAVVGHDVLRDHAARHNVTVIEAARALNVTHILRINALAAVPSAGSGRFVRHYYHADADGSPKGVATLPPPQADLLDILAMQREGQSPLRDGVRLLLDVTVERVDDGELTWFYRASYQSGHAQARELSLFVVCEDRTCRPAHGHAPPSQRPKRSESLRLKQPAASTSAPESLGKLTRDFATRLKAATTSQAEAPAPHDAPPP